MESYKNDNSKNENRRIFLLFFPYYIAHFCFHHFCFLSFLFLIIFVSHHLCFLSIFVSHYFYFSSFLCLIIFVSHHFVEYAVAPYIKNVFERVEKVLLPFSVQLSSNPTINCVIASAILKIGD